MVRVLPEQFRANASKIVKHLGKERVVKRRLEAFVFETEFSQITLQQMQGETTKDGEVLGAIEHSQAGIILAEDDIECPVDGVLN